MASVARRVQPSRSPGASDGDADYRYGAMVHATSNASGISELFGTWAVTAL
jgi:hypothetical protein